MVTVRHAGGYETQYLHLSAFGPGIQSGVRVAQGQLLGRVGMTGSATGPHLDYRIKRNGIHVNPTLERSRMRPGEPIGATTMPAFMQERDRVLGSLDQLLDDKAHAHQAQLASRLSCLERELIEGREAGLCSISTSDRRALPPKLQCFVSLRVLRGSRHAMTAGHGKNDGMSLLFPFRALRPAPDAASRVASVPYDVVNTEEARALVAGKPLSFLHVTRSEIDLPPATNPYTTRCTRRPCGTSKTSSARRR